MWNHPVKAKKLSWKHKTIKTYEVVVEYHGKQKKIQINPKSKNQNLIEMIGDDRKNIKGKR